MGVCVRGVWCVGGGQAGARAEQEAAGGTSGVMMCVRTNTVPTVLVCPGY